MLLGENTMKRSNKAGYTLLELITVVAIIVILAGAASYGIVSSITNYKSHAAANAEHNNQFEGLAQEALDQYEAPGVNTATPTPRFTPTPVPTNTPFPTNSPTPAYNSPTPTPGNGGGGGGGGNISGSASLNCWNDNSGALSVSGNGPIQSATITFPAGYSLSIGSCDWRYSVNYSGGNSFTLTWNGNDSPQSSIQVYNLSWTPNSRPSSLNVSLTGAN